MPSSTTPKIPPAMHKKIFRALFPSSNPVFGEAKWLLAASAPVTCAFGAGWDVRPSSRFTFKRMVVFCGFERLWPSFDFPPSRLLSKLSNPPRTHSISWRSWVERKSGAGTTLPLSSSVVLSTALNARMSSQS